MKRNLTILIFTISLLTCAEREILAQVLETKLIHLNDCIRIFGEERFVIKTEEEFLSAVRGDDARRSCLESQEKIDFKKHSLIGIGLQTGYCRTPVGLAFQVVKNRPEKHYALNIAYIDPQGKTCRTPARFDLWLLVPKLPGDFDVRFSVKAVARGQ